MTAPANERKQASEHKQRVVRPHEPPRHPMRPWMTLLFALALLWVASFASV